MSNVHHAAHKLQCGRTWTGNRSSHGQNRGSVQSARCERATVKQGYTGSTVMAAKVLHVPPNFIIRPGRVLTIQQAQASFTQQNGGPHRVTELSIQNKRWELLHKLVRGSSPKSEATVRSWLRWTGTTGMGAWSGASGGPTSSMTSSPTTSS